MATPRAHDRQVDLGVVQTLTGAGITTAYRNSSAVVSPGGYTRFTVKLVTIGGTNITAVLINVQASKDGLVWESVAAGDAAGANPLATDQSFNLGVAGTTQANSVHVPPGFKLLRTQVKVTGGAGQTGETITVSALAYPA